MTMLVTDSLFVILDRSVEPIYASTYCSILLSHKNYRPSKGAAPLLLEVLIIIVGLGVLHV